MARSSGALVTREPTTVQSASSGHSHGLFRPATMAEFAARAKAQTARAPVFRGGRRAHIATGRSTIRTSIATPSVPKVVLYGGLNKDGIRASDNGTSQLTPPDSTGSVGPSHYVE